MNIFNKVTLQSLKKNKTRTIVTIIGVVLSATMLCAVMTSVSSFMNYIKDTTIYDDGDWHGRISDTTKQTFEQIENHENVRDALAVQQMGYAELKDSQDKDRPYLYVLGNGEKAEMFLPVHMTSGTYPTSDKEIILPEYLYRNSGVSYRIGDQITLSLGERIYEGQKMTQNNPCRLYKDGKLEFNGEKLEIRETRTYTVVGFFERLNPQFENYNSPGFTAFTLMDSSVDAGAYDVYFRLSNPKQYREVMESGTFPVSNEMAEKHDDLLMFYGEAPFANFFKMVYSMAAIVIALIMFGSVSLIYNAFSISVSERTKQFGLLSSIGATKKQLRRSVFFEAFAVSIIGIPLGILVGIGGIGVTFLLIGDKFRSMGFPTALRLHVSASHILITVLIALITVLISAWIPSKRATKVSAIDAIRQSGDIKGKNKPIKTSKLTYKIFGLSGTLASKHYKRSKKKYRATVISLFMSIVLFVSAFSFTDYLMESVDGGIGNSGYDLSLNYEPYLKGNISEDDFLHKIREIQTVKEAVCVSSMFANMKIDDKNLTKKILDEKNIWTLAEQNASANGSDVVINSYLTFIDEDSFRQLLQENGLKEKDFMNSEHPQAIVVDGKTLYRDDSQRYEKVTFFRNDTFEMTTRRGKPIEGYYYLGLTEDENGKEIAQYAKDDGQDGASEHQEYLYVPVDEALYDVNISVGKVIYDMPYYINDTSPITIIYPVNMMQKIVPDIRSDTNICQFFMTSSNHRETYKELKGIIESNNLSADRIFNEAEAKENSRNIVTIIRVFAFGFIILISLIAATNVFNTISTNISLRRREFAMLKSIGMTKKGLNKMMNYECLLYGSKALLYGLPCAVGITFLIWKSAGIGFETNFRLPWVAIIIAVISVFAVVFVTMMYAMKKIKKENLIDALKNENI